MQYSGRLVEAGEINADLLGAIASRFDTMLGFGPRSTLRLNERNRVCGSSMTRAVKLLQTLHVDADGPPLEADGQLGAITWAAPFGVSTVPNVVKATAPCFAGIV